MSVPDKVQSEVHTNNIDNFDDNFALLLRNQPNSTWQGLKPSKKLSMSPLDGATGGNVCKLFANLGYYSVQKP